MTASEDEPGLTVEWPHWPFDPWCAGYLADAAAPGPAPQAGTPSAAATAAVDRVVAGLLAQPGDKQRSALARSITFLIYDAYRLDDCDRDRDTEDPRRPLDRWLDYYLTSNAEGQPLGTLGIQCRAAAHDLVTALPDNPTIEQRAVFSRQLAALVHDAYLLDGWDEYEVWP